MQHDSFFIFFHISSYHYLLSTVKSFFSILEQRQIEEQLRVQYIASDEVWIPPGSPDHVPENQPPVSILPLNNFSETYNRWNSQQQQQPPPIYKYEPPPAYAEFDENATAQ